MEQSTVPYELLKDETVWQVGNRRSGNLDYVVGAASASRESILARMKQSYADCRVSDDCVQVQHEGLLYSFAVFTPEQLKCRIADIFALRVYGEIRPWVKGYWTPESFLLDLMHSDRICGDEHRHEELVRYLLHGWDRYVSELSAQIETEIACKQKDAEKQPEGSFWSARLLSDVALAQARLKNIRSEDPKIGFPHII